MPLLHFYDRAGLRAARDLPLPRDLLDLIRARVANMEAQGLLDLSELVVVDRDTTEADVLDAIGWSPLVSAFDYVHETAAGFHVAVQLVGNAGFGFELIFCPDADPRFVQAVRGHEA